jgi:hypothetical protein
MVQKLVLYISLLPLTLNGLWLVCRNPPPDAQQTSDAQAGDSNQSFASDKGAPDKEMDQEAECEKICAREMSTCLPPAGDKTSVTIVFFGVAIFLPLGQIGVPLAARATMPDFVNLHCDPTISRLSPPPKSLT